MILDHFVLRNVGIGPFWSMIEEKRTHTPTLIMGKEQTCKIMFIYQTCDKLNLGDSVRKLVTLLAASCRSLGHYT